jgi:hypothetical protein
VAEYFWCLSHISIEAEPESYAEAESETDIPQSGYLGNPADQYGERIASHQASTDNTSRYAHPRDAAHEGYHFLGHE